MTRPVFLHDDLGPDRLTLAGPEGRHAATVRRLRSGESVDVVDGHGGRAACRVAAVGRGVVELEVLERSREPPPQPRLVLVQALAKGDRGELAVELATEVGVDEVVPWAAERCVVRWEGPRGDKALERWRSAARAAAKQSRRSWLPPVVPLETTADVAERLRAAAAGLLLHEAAAPPLATATLPARGDVVLVVGPEGGLTDREVQTLTGAGGAAVRLGPSVLRTSTAGAVAAAVVCVRTGRWG